MKVRVKISLQNPKFRFQNSGTRFQNAKRSVPHFTICQHLDGHKNRRGHFVPKENCGSDYFLLSFKWNNFFFKDLICLTGIYLDNSLEGNLSLFIWQTSQQFERFPIPWNRQTRCPSPPSFIFIHHEIIQNKFTVHCYLLLTPVREWCFRPLLKIFTCLQVFNIVWYCQSFFLSRKAHNLIWIKSAIFNTISNKTIFNEFIF